MNYTITHRTNYDYSQAVPVCHNLVHLMPKSLPYQNCNNFSLIVHPEPVSISSSTDYFGNETSYFSIDHAHQGLTVTATSQVSVSPKPKLLANSSPPWEKVIADLKKDRTAESLEAYQFTFRSPGIKQFPELQTYAKPSFAAGRPLLSAVTDLTARIFRDFNYDPRATTVHTEISEVYEKKHGVCQDFAHFQIGCLRSLGLAARYVSGYLRTEPPPGKPRLVGADASHAWLSVYCGKVGWVDFDPTNNLIPGTDHVTLAWGRDYQDVSPIQGTIVGGGEHQLSVSVDVAPIESSAEG